MIFENFFEYVYFTFALFKTLIKSIGSEQVIGTVNEFGESWRACAKYASEVIEKNEFLGNRT